MQTSNSLWAQTMARLFGKAYLMQSPKRSRKRSITRRCLVEALEVRTVFSASFGSALSIDNSQARDVATDTAGNSYVTGNFSGTVDFDQSRTHVGDVDILTARGGTESTDAYIAKYAPDDSLVWVRRMGGDRETTGGTITDVGRNIAVDAGGGVYVSGEFWDSADFGSTTLNSSGTRGSFVSKLDAGGSFVWSVNLGVGYAAQKGMDIDSQGNVFVLTRPGATTIDIRKLGPNGQAVWLKSLQISNFWSGDLDVDGTGNVVIVGGFSQTVDFDPGSKVKSISVGSRNASFVLELDSQGSFKWVSHFVGTGQVYADSVT
ncbi:MAG: hypothetical protein ABI557_04895, partial [Aureliella sp.]